MLVIFEDGQELECAYQYNTEDLYIMLQSLSPLFITIDD